MKLYYSKGACSLAVRILIHELDIPCEYEAVNLATKQTKSGKDYLQINPKGAVPTLVLDNQEVLTENSAIQQYLADTHKATHLLPPVGDLKRYRVLEWLSFISTDLHKGFGPLFNAKVPAEIKETIFIPGLKTKFNIVEQWLNKTKNKFLLGEQLMLPDGYMFVMLSWFPHFKIDLTEYPNLNRYFAELKKVKAIQAALAEEGF